MDKKNDLMIKVCNFLRKNEWCHALKVLEENDCDINYSNEYVSDLGINMLPKESLIPFFKEVIKKGGNPAGWHTNLSSLVKKGLVEELEWLYKLDGYKSIGKNVVFPWSVSVMEEKKDVFHFFQERFNIQDFKNKDGEYIIIETFLTYKSFDWMFNCLSSDINLAKDLAVIKSLSKNESFNEEWREKFFNILNENFLDIKDIVFAIKNDKLDFMSASNEIISKNFAHKLNQRIEFNEKNKAGFGFKI